MAHSTSPLLALLCSAWLAATLPGCGIDELLDDGESSQPTPDDVATAALAPKPARTDKAIGKGVICPGSFTTFKRRITDSSKDPGPGYEWHHIVNQNSTNKKEFGNRLHCTDNLIALPKAVHERVTAHFNGKFSWTKGEFVRDIINKRSWSEQYEYGLNILRDKGVKP